MEISNGQMKQKRLQMLAKGVGAAALTIDNKFREAYGEPEFQCHANGSYKRGKDGFPKYSRNSPYRVAMVTLTYRRDGMWEEKQIAELIKHYREWFRRNAKHEAIPECHYVWVMELTEIGRPHYHIVMWMPKGIKPPMPDKQGWWPHGSTEAKFAHSPVGYIIKYASKGETKSGRHVPHRARLWGYGGLKMTERGAVDFARAPRWLKKLAHHESRPKRRLYERVVKSITYACGHVHQHVIRKAGWVLTAGVSAGFWFFSPYDYAGFTGDGIALSHRGHIEVLTPDGDEFFLPHKG